MEKYDAIYRDYWKIKEYGKELHPEKVIKIISCGNPQTEAMDIQSPQLNEYFRDLKEGGKVLDIGAGNKDIEDALKNRCISAHYSSMDTASRSNINYDYSDIDEIEERFDLIIMQEIIEHMPMVEGLHYLRKAYELLNDGGWLVVTTPNTRKPVWFNHVDVTHIQRWPLSDLYGLLRVTAFTARCTVATIEICAS